MPDLSSVSSRIQSHVGPAVQIEFRGHPRTTQDIKRKKRQAGVCFKSTKPISQCSKFFDLTKNRDLRPPRFGQAQSYSAADRHE